MNTKTKNIVAILMASIIAMAIFAPTAMATNNNGGTPITIEVPNEPPEVVCKCEFPNPVTPNPDPDAPLDEQATVTICAVVCDPNGKDDIKTVIATVYRPDGSPLHENVEMGPGACNCDPLKPEIAQSPVLCDRLDDPTCKLVVSEPLVMTIREPGGEYRVVVTATDAGGLVDKLQNRFVFESIVAFEIDFTELVFENIKICVPSYIVGDNVMGTPAPTIHNTGNDPIQIGFHYSFGQDVPTIKMDVNGDWFDPCEVYWDGKLEGYCDTMPLNFSLHVENGTPAGPQTGYIEITAREVHTVRLENKKTDDIDLYEPIILDELYGELTYVLETCEFDFEGYGLGDPTQYCLIYYTEPWGTLGYCLGKLSDEGTLSSTFPCCIPSGGDWSYDRSGLKKAKIWLVPCSDYTGGCPGPGTLTGWHPGQILFEMETIECCAH